MESSPLIAPFVTGLQHNKESWLCAPDSFQQMMNARIEHGYVSVGRGYYKSGQTPSKLPITGFSTHTPSVGVKEVLIWDTQNLWLYHEGGVSVPSVNKKPLFSKTFYFIKSVEVLGISGERKVYFTSGEPLAGDTDGLWVYKSGSGASIFSPTTGSTTIVGAKALGILRGRLLLFGTYEEENGIVTYFPSRVRWSEAGTPSLFDEKSGGGYADAAVAGEVVAVENLQNFMVVVFDSGLWALDSTWDSQQPFVWRRSDDNVRCFSEKSLIPYPLDVKIIGQRGILATDTRQVERIDDLIPQYISKNMDWNQGKTFFGFREYIYQTLWYLYTYSETTEELEDKYMALIRDEVSQAFSTYEVPFNILGYGYSVFSYRCSDFIRANKRYWTVSSQIGKRIKDYRNLGEETLLGGDIQGGLYLIDRGYFKGFSQKSLLRTAEWNPFVSEGKQSRFLYLDIFVEAVENQQLTVSFFKDNSGHPYKKTTLSLLPYLGCLGNIVEVQSGESTFLKVPFHGLEEPQPVYIYECEGMPSLNSIEGVMAYPINPSLLVLKVNSTGWGEYLGGGVVCLRPFESTKTWKRVYAGGTGFTHSVSLEFEGKETTYFKLHALKPKFVARGKRLI